VTWMVVGYVRKNGKDIWRRRASLGFVIPDDGPCTAYCNVEVRLLFIVWLCLLRGLGIVRSTKCTSTASEQRLLK
jgi:hypothetical protein